MGFRISAVLICLAAMAGLGADAYAAEEGGKTEFFRNLLRKQEATIEDAIHATARYKGFEGQTNVAAEVSYLGQRGIQFPKGVNAILNNPLDKGSATFILLKALGVKGGVMFHLFSGSQRYALKEAIDLGFIPATSVVSEKMSGGDLMGLLVKVVEYRERKGADEEGEGQ